MESLQAVRTNASVLPGRSLFVLCLLAISLSSGTADPPSPKRPDHEVFAFCHDIHDAQKRDYVQQAAMLKQLGFDGAGHVELEDIEKRLASLDDAQLRLYLAGITIDLKHDLDPQLVAMRKALPMLEGRQLVVYCILRGLPPGSIEGTAPAVTAVRILSDLAAPRGVRMGIYPHTGDWVATVPQAVALARHVDRDNCGVIFNLCHFLRNEPLESLDQVLELAAPYLMAVTLNGADLAGKNDNDWKRLIQPLDQGTFDLAELLRKLAHVDYAGPVGIMCFGIGGDAQEHLARSLGTWRRLVGNAR